MGGGKKVVVEPHRHEGVFIARGKEDALVTKNMAIGESVYGEKRIAVEEEAGKVEYRVWNPFRSKLAAAILGGVDKIHMPPGSMFFTWELLVAQLLVMYLMLWDLRGWCMRSSSVTGRAGTSSMLQRKGLMWFP